MKYFLMLAVLAVQLGLMALIIWYVPARLSKLLAIHRSRRLRLGAAFVVVAGFFGMFGLAHAEQPALGALGVFSGLAFFCYFYLACFLLLLDALRLAVPVPARLGAWAAVGASVLLTALGYAQAGSFSVRTIDIPVAGLAHDVAIMHISDLHLGHHRGRKYLERIVRETNERSPDLVILNGDLVDSNGAVDPGVLGPLADFRAAAYFTTGNHEAYVDTQKALNLIAGYGVRILHNEKIATKGLQLAGLDYMKADDEVFDMHPVGDRTIKAELPKIPLAAGTPVVLVHHSPVGVKYVSDRKIALMLSGHTHGGQVFPATWLITLFFPMSTGLYETGNTKVFVSPGAGTFGPRMRLGSSNEINLIRLKATAGDRESERR